MKRLLFAALVLVLGLSLLTPPSAAHAYGDVYTDFDGITIGTLAEDISLAGATFDGGGAWVVESSFFSLLTGNMLYQPTFSPEALTISFDGVYDAYSMTFATVTAYEFYVTGYLNGEMQFQDTFVGTFTFFAEGYASGDGVLFDQLVIDSEGDLAAIDDLWVSIPAVDYPNAGEIQIGAGAPVQAYAAAGNYPTGITLPADYDGNGYDTYIVTGTATVSGETWYSIWIGGEDYVWVPASQVTALR